MPEILIALVMLAAVIVPIGVIVVVVMAVRGAGKPMPPADTTD